MHEQITNSMHNFQEELSEIEISINTIRDESLVIQKELAEIREELTAIRKYVRKPDFF